MELIINVISVNGKPRITRIRAVGNECVRGDPSCSTSNDDSGLKVIASYRYIMSTQDGVCVMRKIWLYPLCVV